MSAFLNPEPPLENYLRSIILFGQNVASHKFVFAKSLIELSGCVFRDKVNAIPGSR